MSFKKINTRDLNLRCDEARFKFFERHFKTSFRVFFWKVLDLIKKILEFFRFSIASRLKELEMMIEKKIKFTILSANMKWIWKKI